LKSVLSETLGLIPARMAASRLPGKPLADIAGVPMIVHVWQKAKAAGLARIAVATDDETIANVVVKAGGEAILTRSDHPSGSDRIWEAAQKLDPKGHYKAIVNIQGDLPLLNPDHIQDAVSLLEKENVAIGTLAAPVTSEAEADNPNVVKVVGSPLSKDVLNALYFTRARAPWGQGPLYHHIGLYAYRRDALQRFVSLPPSPLEQREKLEQLRALEDGMRINVAIVDAVPIGVDTLEDLEKVRKIVQES
jgi:3-deoxy-manno-octulosonate cytidylyltransferase (CMP-KDO synthetase)